MGELFDNDEEGASPCALEEWPHAAWARSVGAPMRRERLAESRWPRDHLLNGVAGVECVRARERDTGIETGTAIER
jgi:hypothetical protein